jgi:hypothetical protein
MSSSAKRKASERSEPTPPQQTTAPQPINGTAYSVEQMRHLLARMRRLEAVAVAARLALLDETLASRAALARALMAL